jgi:DNA-binding LacI/PurR family transcriptional regulator
MPATIADIAARSGVGLGTVSRVLNGSPRVSAETREKVEAAISALNYVPSAAARGLSRGRTFNIAVMAPFFTRSAFVERIRGIEAAIADSPYDMVIYNVETVEKRDRCYRTVPDRRRADGVIIISLPPSADDLLQIAGAGLPIVFMDVKDPACAGFDRVLIDDVRGGRLATEHLIGLGHRRIGFIGDIPQPGFNFTSGSDRFAGYCQALDAAGLAFRPDYHLDGVFGQKVARDLALGMLSLPERPTAIFASNDTQALGVLEAARDLGLDVPGDLSVVGYDDIEISEFLGLTTVRQRLFESGQHGVGALLGRIDDPAAAPRCDILPIELIVRRTTSPPR